MDNSRRYPNRATAHAPWPVRAKTLTELVTGLTLRLPAQALQVRIDFTVDAPH